MKRRTEERVKDLYKHLGVSDSVGEAEIRAAAAAAPPELREAAEVILLDPARRSVYDRNRRVLMTVGRLRAHLGMNLTRFWPRSRFADFTISLAPASPEAAARPIDATTMAWAFGVDVLEDAPPRRRGRRRLLAAAGLALGAAAALALWYWRQAQ